MRKHLNYILLGIGLSAVSKTLAYDPAKALEEFGKQTSDALRRHDDAPGPKEQAQNVSEAFRYELQLLEEKHFNLNEATFTKMVQDLILKVSVLDQDTRQSSLPVVVELRNHYRAALENSKAKSDKRSNDRIESLNRLLLKLEQ